MKQINNVIVSAATGAVPFQEHVIQETSKIDKRITYIHLAYARLSIASFPLKITGLHVFFNTIAKNRRLASKKSWSPLAGKLHFLFPPAAACLATPSHCVSVNDL